MGLSKSNDELYDSIRKKWVENTPEEEIRQALIEKMVGELGYPKVLIVVEKELSQLPHLQTLPKKEVPKRRIDIMAFTKDPVSKTSLIPLLVIECKAVKLTSKFAQQVIGYNHFIKAPFVAIANKEEVLTGYFDPEVEKYRFKKGIPDYASIQAARKRVRIPR